MDIPGYPWLSYDVTRLFWRSLDIVGYRWNFTISLDIVRSVFKTEIEYVYVNLLQPLGPQLVGTPRRPRPPHHNIPLFPTKTGASPHKNTKITRAKPVPTKMSKTRQTSNRIEQSTDTIEPTKPKTKMMMRCSPPRHPMDKPKEDLYEETREAGSPEDETTILELLKEDLHMDLASEELYDISKISYALLRITRIKDTPKLVTKCLRTLAIVLDEIDEKKSNADTNTTKIIEEATTTIIEPHIKEIDYKLESLLECMEKQHEEIKVLLTKTVELTENKTETQQTNTTNKTAKSYAQATRTNVPTEHAPNIDSTTIKAWQILIDKDTETGHYPMAFLTEKQIITKAEMAITQMGEIAEDKPEGFKFLGTKKLRRGAAILVLSKEEDATWLKQDEKMKSFISHLGLSASCYRLRTYPIFTTFVPLTFDSNTIALRRIEDNIGLHKGTIVSANWIKPPSKRSKDQTCGHMIFTLSDPEAANKLIRN